MAEYLHKAAKDLEQLDEMLSSTPLVSDEDVLASLKWLRAAGKTNMELASHVDAVVNYFHWQEIMRLKDKIKSVVSPQHTQDTDDSMKTYEEGLVQGFLVTLKRQREDITEN